MEENKLSFDKQELTILYALLNVNIQAVNHKRHKTRKDIEVISELKKLSNKIDEFMSRKE